MRKVGLLFLAMSVIVLTSGCSDDKTTGPEPSTTFEQTIGGDLADEASGVVAMSDGGFVLASLRDGWTPDNPSAVPNVHLTKFDADGKVTWDQVIREDRGTWGCVMAQADDGGFLVAGNSGIDGDPYIVRTDASGTVQWDKELSSMGFDALPSGIQHLSGGSCAIVGLPPYAKREVVSGRISSAGDMVWINRTQMTSNESHRGEGLAETSDGGYLVTGSVGSTYNPGWADMYLVKVDASGETEWTKTIGGEEVYERGASIVASSDGHFLVAGYTSSQDLAEIEDAYIVKVDAQGDVIWEKTFGGDGRDAATALVATDDGGCVALGWTESSGAGGQDVYLLKINADGGVVWERTFGGTGDDVGTALAVASDGGFLIAGETTAVDDNQNDILLIKTDGQGEL